MISKKTVRSFLTYISSLSHPFADINIVLLLYLLVSSILDFAIVVMVITTQMNLEDQNNSDIDNSNFDDSRGSRQ